jgi:hypothetical protein
MLCYSRTNLLSVICLSNCSKQKDESGPLPFFLLKKKGMSTSDTSSMFEWSFKSVLKECKLD